MPPDEQLIPIPDKLQRGQKKSVSLVGRPPLTKTSASHQAPAGHAAVVHPEFMAMHSTNNTVPPPKFA
jgi:hypothetical protein